MSDQLRQASDDDYGLLAWMLRSRPGFLREQTVTEWAWAILAPKDKPDNVAYVRGLLAATVASLTASFNEFDQKWYAFDYFAYAQAVNA